MAHGTVEFFGTEGVQAPAFHASWAFQDGGAAGHTRTRTGELGASGDEIGSGFHDDRTATSFTYAFRQTAEPVANYVWPKVGAIYGGWHLDGFSCAWSRDRKSAVLTATCHRHDGKAHDAGRTYTPSLAEVAVVPFGVPAAFGGAFALDAEATVDLRKATYEVKVQHVDEGARDGTHLRGDNHDGAETLAVELTGAATADDYATSWDMPADTVTPSNAGATATSLSFEHHLAHDVPAEAVA